MLPLQRFRVEDTSMRPVVQPGDRLLVGRWLRPRRGKAPIPQAEQCSNTLLSRIVANVGRSICIIDGNASPQ